MNLLLIATFKFCLFNLNDLSPDAAHLLDFFSQMLLLYALYETHPASIVIGEKRDLKTLACPL